MQTLSLMTSRMRGLFRVLLFLLFTTLSLYHCTPAFAAWGATVPNPILEYNYTYDNNGNITNIYNAVAVSTSTFTYDEIDRLTSATGPYGVNNTPVTQPTPADCSNG